MGGMAGGAAITIVIKAIDDYSKETDKAKKNFLGMSKGTTIALAGIATASIYLGKQIFDLAQKTADYEARLKAFNNMAGETSDYLLTTLKGATQGTVSSMQLITQANQAMLLGIDKKALPEMFKSASAVAQATGRTTADAIADITLGIGRQSKLILDNLGVIVNAEKAYDDYAESIGKVAKDLDDEEKRIAFTNAALKGLNENYKKSGGFTENLRTKTQRLSAAYEDMTIALMTGSSGASSAIGNFTDGLSALFNILGEGFKDREAFLQLLEEYKRSTIEAGEASEFFTGTLGYYNVGGFAAYVITKQEEEAMKALARAESGAELSTKDLATVQKTLTIQLGYVNDELEIEKKNLGDVQRKIDTLLGKYVAGELEGEQGIFDVQRKITDKRIEMAQARVDGMDTEDEKYKVLEEDLKILENQEELLSLQQQKKYTDERTQLEMNMKKHQAYKEGVITDFKEMAAGMKPLLDEWDKQYSKVEALNKLLDETQKKMDALGTGGGTSDTKKSSSTSTGSNSWKATVTPVNDFIVTPNGVLNTHPDDFIIGTKNPSSMGSTTIIIEGNIYGVDPDQISEALYNRLSEGIRY